VRATLLPRLDDPHVESTLGAIAAANPLVAHRLARALQFRPATAVLDTDVKRQSWDAAMLTQRSDVTVVLLPLFRDDLRTTRAFDPAIGFTSTDLSLSCPCARSETATRAHGRQSTANGDA